MKNSRAVLTSVIVFIACGLMVAGCSTGPDEEPAPRPAVPSFDSTSETAETPSASTGPSPTPPGPTPVPLGTPSAPAPTQPTQQRSGRDIDRCGTPYLHETGTTFFTDDTTGWTQTCADQMMAQYTPVPDF